MDSQVLSRRDFLESSALCGGVVLADSTGVLAADPGDGVPMATSFTTQKVPAPVASSRLPDLAPARWIWYPRPCSAWSRPRTRRR